MREEFLYYIWENRLTDKDLKTVEGEAVEVVATGFRNTDSGPDFLEAKIQIGDKLWAGHVEIHVKTSDWNRHGHQTDKAYKNVILVWRTSRVPSPRYWNPTSSIGRTHFINY